jgi:hypothetical protein
LEPLPPLAGGFATLALVAGASSSLSLSLLSLLLSLLLLSLLL